MVDPCLLGCKYVTSCKAVQLGISFIWRFRLRDEVLHIVYNNVYSFMLAS
jgi:hypothetical protein